MKKIAALILAFLLLFSLGACAKEPELAGGWSEAESEELSEELIEIFQSAVEGTEYEFFTPVSLLGTQVVAGTNYKFLCTDSDGAEIVLTVYRDLSKNCSVLSAEPQ